MGKAKSAEQTKRITLGCLQDCKGNIRYSEPIKVNNHFYFKLFVKIWIVHRHNQNY